MCKEYRLRLVGLFASFLLIAGSALARDWPQWRGSNRDARAADFAAPQTWPEKLTQKWKVTVGDGVATPALVGDRLFVFSRQGNDEVLRCLNAEDGSESWQQKYEVQRITGPAQGFSGPRSSPVVADGKVVTLGVRGLLNCYEAATGKQLWSKNDFSNSLPRFFTSCSPMVVDGLVIVQLGGESNGAIVAYELDSGAEKWKWTGDGTAYSSPVLLTMDGTKAILAETARNIVALQAASGELLWQTPFAPQQRAYNACTPIVDGQMVLFSGVGRGTHCVRLEKEGNKLGAKENWANRDISVQFNTPVVRQGMTFGIASNDNLFCLNNETGKTAWTHSLRGTDRRGGSGYGSVVDVGSALLALTPPGYLFVFEPTDKEFKQLARYKVGESEAYAYPIAAGKRIYVKDKDTLTLWIVD